MQHAATSSSSIYPNAQPYFGIVENTVQALRLVHAVWIGVVPRVIRRLNDAERSEKIVSGAVFVFSVVESGMRRWTDGRLWSPSRIDGNFLVYREMNEKRGSLRKSDHIEESMPGNSSRAVLSSPREQQGRLYCSPGSFVAENVTANGGLKVGGLVKKTITVTINSVDLHLISYYTQEDVDMRRLGRMSTRPDIMGLDLPPHIFRFSDFRMPPRINTGPNGLPMIVCEPETWPPDGSDCVNDGVYLSHWRSDEEPAPPFTVQDALQVSSIGQIRGASWQEQSDTSQTALRSNSQQVHSSSLATSPEGHHEYSDAPPTVASQYQLQGWPSSHGYHTDQYASFSMTSDTYLPLSQSRDREKVRSSYRDFGVREMSHGGSSETRHVGEGDLVWLSASSQNDVYQNADSRLPVHGIYPLIHHQSVDNACPSNEITFFETQEPPFAGSSQSTSQHPYTLVQDAQLYTVQHREDQYANDREF